MSRKRIMTAEGIRAELARRRMTRKELAKVLGVSPSYVMKIVRGERVAEERRAQITKYLAEMPAKVWRMREAV